jgi:hypothetical protein
MAPLKVMIIRHAEKPLGDEAGVGLTGVSNDQALSVRGWQRAGALVRFFAPKDGRFCQRRPACPSRIFAAGVGPDSESKRHILTAGPLAELLSSPIDRSFLKHQTEELADAIRNCAGAVLVVWEHKGIPRLIELITDHSLQAPMWPDDRFDMVVILDRLVGGWSMTQTPQLLLAGDTDEHLEARNDFSLIRRFDSRAAATR